MDRSAHLLSEHGLKNTPVRRKVLSFMEERKHAVSHAELEGAFNGDADRVTLYRALNTLEEKGIVHKVLGRDGIARYALCQDDCTVHRHDDQHLHFHCNTCKNVFCLAVDDYPEVNLPSGFMLSKIQLSAEGICDNCK
jgi:Fur family transcriptional regulator, ferric uptake regulator